RAMVRDRGPLARRDQHDAGRARPGGASGDARSRGGPDPPLGRLPGAPRRVHDGPPLGGRRHVVSAARHLALGLVPAPDPTTARVGAILRTVHDPEIPTISIVDLGLVHDVRVTDETITVELLPTFVACPALEMIRRDVEDALRIVGR